MGTPPADEPRITDTQGRALAARVGPDPAVILRTDPRRLNMFAAARYILKVRTNVVLILSGASAYFFMTGIQTFGLEFVNRQYGVSTILANLLMLVVGAGAILGIIVGGNAGDPTGPPKRPRARRRHSRHRHRSAVPPRRLHPQPDDRPPIHHRRRVLPDRPEPHPRRRPPRHHAPRLWGRAEGVRTLLRSGAQSIAPLTFGGLSDLLAGTHQGLRYTLIIMLIPLAASGLILLRGLRYYPTDVATAAASNATHNST